MYSSFPYDAGHGSSGTPFWEFIAPLILDSGAVGFVFGPLAEGLAIQTGAWAYASPSVLGIPLWLPFVWGNAALFIQNSADFGKAIFAKDTAPSTAPDVVAPLAHLVGDDAPAHERAEDDAAEADREHRLERRGDDDRAEQRVRGA